MAHMVWNILGILAPLVFGAAAYLLGRRYGRQISNWFYRRGQAQAEEMRATFARMFKEVSLWRCQLVVAAGALLGLLAGLYLTRELSFWPNLAFALLTAYLGWRLPRPVMAQLYRRYVRGFDDQLVDGLTMVANALRSGLSLVQSLDLVVKEMPPPISQEFGYMMEEHRMGTRLEESLERMSERIPCEDLGIVVQAVLVLRETGGNLSETFDTIVYTIRERKRVEGKIRAMTAQGVSQGIILTAMPFVLAYVLHVMNPDYIRPLFTTVVGWLLLLLMCLLLLAGGLMIRKIVKIEV